ncbi:MAG: PDZ domain-containing protein [Anaerolineales bacterium]|nr:PDZ domain-containing protein [Anaerolineales bacterium]
MDERFLYPPNRPLVNGPSKVAIVASVVIAAILGGIVGATFTSIFFNREIQPAATPLPVVFNEPTQQEIALEINTAITDAVQEVAPSVVTVINHLPPMRTISGEVIEQSGSGSGAIISQEGFIISNFHVIEDASEIEVILFDGSRRPAELIGIDPYGDIAIIKAEGSMPAVASWGNSDLLKPGETVIAIGSPLGDFTNTVTVGVVSATGRNIETGQDFQLEGLIQTDAAINQGNSGGPLVNLAGQIVGINTLIVRGRGPSSAVTEGLGFAVPSNVSRAVAEKLIQDGSIARPFLGANWGWITPDIATRFGLPIDYGIFLTDVMRNGPAYDAGLRQGDIITAINGEPFDDDHPFINTLFQYEPGETLTVQAIREGETLEVTLILGKM